MHSHAFSPSTHVPLIRFVLLFYCSFYLIHFLIKKIIIRSNHVHFSLRSSSAEYCSRSLAYTSLHWQTCSRPNRYALFSWSDFLLRPAAKSRHDVRYPVSHWHHPPGNDGLFYHVLLIQRQFRHFGLHENRWSRVGEHWSWYASLHPAFRGHPNQNHLAKSDLPDDCIPTNKVKYGPYLPGNRYSHDLLPPGYQAWFSRIAFHPSRFLLPLPMILQNQLPHHKLPGKSARSAWYCPPGQTPMYPDPRLNQYGSHRMVSLHIL